VIFWVGLFPQPLLHRSEARVHTLLSQMTPRGATARAAVSPGAAASPASRLPVRLVSMPGGRRHER
jgi:hypothetical protein